MLTALVLSGGFGSPDFEWKLSPLVHICHEKNIKIIPFKKQRFGLGDIWQQGIELCDFINSMQEDYENVFVLGHSLGGLVARAADVMNIDSQPWQGTITVGTPHYGTYLAALAPWSKAAQQMRPSSEFLHELNNEQTFDVPVYSLACRFDECLIPPRSAIWAGSVKTDVVNATHVSVIWNLETALKIIYWIEECLQERIGLDSFQISDSHRQSECLPCSSFGGDSEIRDAS